MGRSGWAFGRATALASILAVTPFQPARTEVGPAFPAALATLQQQLRAFRFCEDEIVGGEADWWGFWWSLPEKGCGDCEAFAAYSYARLRKMGVPADDLRLVAAEVGVRDLADGAPARVLHVWLEARIDGRTWTVWNGKIRAGAWRERELLTEAQVAALVEDRFGPNWPYGIELD